MIGSIAIVRVAIVSIAIVSCGHRKYGSTLIERLQRAAHPSQMGSSMATMGVLLRKAEKSPTGRHSRSSALRWPRGLPRAGSNSHSTARVSSSARATTKSAPARVKGPREGSWKGSCAGRYERILVHIPSAQCRHVTRGGRAMRTRRTMSVLQTLVYTCMECCASNVHMHGARRWIGRRSS